MNAPSTTAIKAPHMHLGDCLFIDCIFHLLICSVGVTAATTWLVYNIHILITGLLSSGNSPNSENSLNQRNSVKLIVGMLFA